ncbi:hypothetical protein CJ030_MR0G000128 [Morella rubra]|uniref:Myb/SANT-like domain-containing protein n=1 Tax=Morella rubra TaxID=262757 RepID=A0A6A1UMU3_9ROSI|nr:hypothetical protein CJ030_MR0G000128 [Morella rubra]
MDEEEHLWTTTTELLSLNILRDCVGSGTIVSGRFDAKAQNTVAKLINRCVKRPFTTKQVKGKWDRLKRGYSDFAFILKQTGFGWDDDRHTVVASEEAWSNLLNLNPKLGRYKQQGCPNFDLMRYVFSHSTATGSGRHASTHAPVSPVNEPLSEDVQYNMGPVHVDLEQDPPVITQMGSPPQATLSPRNVRGKRVVDGSGGHVGNMSENSEKSQPPCSTMKCIQWLSELSPPLPESQYHAAIDRLLENKERQLAFLEMPPEERLEWLYRL